MGRSRGWKRTLAVALAGCTLGSGLVAGTALAVTPVLSTFPGTTAIGTPTYLPSIEIGESFRPATVVTGGADSAGLIYMNVYEDGDVPCSTSIGGVGNIPLLGDGTYFMGGPSGLITPAAPGTYKIVANSTPAGMNTAAISPCNGVQTITVTKRNPAVVATPSVSAITLGASFHPVATLSGGYNPIGSLTTKVYGPGDPNCVGGDISHSNSVVAGNTAYNGVAYTPTAAGTYHVTATYEGDTNNNGASSPLCGPANAVLVSAPASTGENPPVTVKAKCKKKKRKGKSAAASKKKGCKKKKKR